MYARPFINSLDFAANGRQISGEIPVVALPRLLEMLEGTQGVLRYTVQGGMTRLGNPMLEIGIAGTCRLCCQRCLNALDYKVKLDTRLLLCDQAGLDALDAAGHEEEFDSILAETNLDVLNLLEEEILLSLPFAPSHEFGACQAADGGSKQENNPFAVLSKLKRN